MGSGKRIEPYSGIEAKAHPFTGVDEADYWKSLHGMEPSRSFIVQSERKHDLTEAVLPPC